MEVVPRQVHRTLAYVGLVGRGGGRVPRAAVSEYYDWAERGSNDPMHSILLAMTQRAARGALGVDESPIDYLCRLGWLSVDRQGNAGLTDVGAALLRGLDAADDGDVIETVLDDENPFAYAIALAQLGDTGPALLVDPYLRMEQLIALADLDNVTRVLVGNRLASKDLTGLRQVAKVICQRRTVEIRVSATIHDRYLIPDAPERVQMLGASLGTIGKKLTTLTALSDRGSEELRTAHERYWAEAEPLAIDEPDGMSAGSPPTAPVPG